MAVLTKSQVASIRADLATAFTAVAQKHGVDFSIGNIRFSPESMRTTLTGVVRSAATSVTAGPVDLKALALAKSGKLLLGPTFNPAAKYYSKSIGIVSFAGYNSRARAYPFIVKTASGKRYKIASFGAKEMVAAGAVA